jgi:hypothetical protein
MTQLLAIVTLLAGLGFPLLGNGAEPVDSISRTDAIEIHAVVQSQLEALAEDDAESAFQLTTTEKRMQIGSPENFMRLIKAEYDPIYRNLRVIFSPPEVLEGNAIQVVRVIDRGSHVWLAVFWMQQDEDAHWKIDGCHLLETTSISI